MTRAIAVLAVLGACGGCKADAEYTGIGTLTFDKTTLASVELPAFCQATDLNDGRKGTWCFQQPPFKPATRVLIFGEQEQTPVVPSAAGDHVFPNPGIQLGDPRVGAVRIPTCNPQHLVNERLVANAGIDRLSRLVLFLCDPRFRLRLVFRFVLQFHRFKQRSIGLDGWQV